MAILMRLRPKSLRVENEVTTAEWRMLVTLADLREVESGNLTGMWGLEFKACQACVDYLVVTSSLFLALEAHEVAPECLM